MGYGLFEFLLATKLGPFRRWRDGLRSFGTMVFVCLLASSCAVFETRPAKQMAYAEAAMQAALLANAETNPETAPVFQLARDSLSKARSFYRLKNFKEARRLAVRARRLAEEAEWKALRGNSDSNGAESLVK